MKRIIKFTVLFLISILIILPLFARPAVENNNYGRKWDMTWQDLNQLNIVITNFGKFGHNVSTGDPGGYWPAGYPAENYLYGCGIWVGALVDTAIDENGDTLRDTLVTCGYNPNSGMGEFSPGDGSDAPLYSNPEDIVYKSTSDNNGYGWPLKKADGSDSIVSMQDTWAKYSDKDSTQHFHEDNKPLGLLVNQYGYTWVGPLKEDIVFLKFEITNDREDGRDLTKCFVGVAADLDIGNESGTSANDLLGFIDTMTIDGELRFLNLGYQFQLEEEAGWAHTPGIVAFKYMESPIASEPIDLYHDGSVIIQPGQQIGMTTFNYFTLQTDPVNKIERYVVMAGYNHLEYDPGNPEDSYRPFPDWGQGTSGYPGQSEPAVNAGDKRFIMSSGPFTIKHDSTANIVIAIMVAKNVDELLDKALTAQTIYDAGFKGPVAPDQVEFSLKGLDEKVVIYWDNADELIPDRYYEDASDPTSLLYNPAYRQYDVEGYKVYRSRTGAGGTWELLAQYDLINDITAEISDSIITWDVTITASYDSATGDSVYDTLAVRNVEYLYDTVGYNTGVPYFYIDSNLVNGITYYYTVTAYDFNFNDVGYNADSSVYWGSDPLILESAGKTKAVIPRSVSSNYVSSYATVVLDTLSFTNIDGTAGPHPIDTTAMVISVNPIVDTLIERLKYYDFEIKFTGATQSDVNTELPGYTYEIWGLIDGLEDTLLYSDVMNMDTVTIVNEDFSTTQIWINAPSSGFAYNGIVFKIDSFSLNRNTWPSNENTDVIKTITGSSYTDSIVKLEFAGIPGDVYFHGSLWYRIIWHETVDTTGDTLLTLEVWDVQNNIQIPYDSTQAGDIWHFNTASGDYPEYISSSTANTVRSGLYFSGFYLYFNKPGAFPQPLNWADRPHEGDEWEFKINITDSSSFDMPPVGAKYIVHVTPFELAQNSDSTLMNIKTVPNPYVVRDEYDLDYRYRKIYFTNLPDKCTIRIYTLSGDLIKTIEHDVELVSVSTTNDTTVIYDYTKGAEEWDVLTDNDQIPAPGVYLYHVLTPDGASFIGKFAIIK